MTIAAARNTNAATRDTALHSGPPTAPRPPPPPRPRRCRLPAGTATDQPECHRSIMPGSLAARRLHSTHGQGPTSETFAEASAHRRGGDAALKEASATAASSRAVFDKSHHQQARSARPLGVEAGHQLRPPAL